MPKQGGPVHQNVVQAHLLTWPSIFSGKVSKKKKVYIFICCCCCLVAKLCPTLL